MGASLRDRATRPADQAAARLGDSASVPSATEIQTAIRNKYEALVEARESLAAQAALVQRGLRDCVAAARIFGIDLPGAGAAERATVANVAVGILSEAGARGATVTELRPAVEDICGALHPKSIGVALLRLSKQGIVRRERRRWFVVSKRSAT